MDQRPSFSAQRLQLHDGACGDPLDWSRQVQAEVVLLAAEMTIGPSRGRAPSLHLRRSLVLRVVCFGGGCSRQLGREMERNEKWNVCV